MKNKLLAQILTAALLAFGIVASAVETPASESTPKSEKKVRTMIVKKGKGEGAIEIKAGEAPPAGHESRTVIVKKMGDGRTMEFKGGEDPKMEMKGRAVWISREGEPGEKETVTYLGVETAPVPRALGAQLGLGKDLGLVVTAVAEKSPASTVLQEHDVLKKLDDQILVDTRQLSILVRAKKAGDEVRLTVVRGGKELVLAAKLGERELPKMMGGNRVIDLHDAAGFRFFNQDGGPAIERLQGLPGLAREEVNDALRVIGGDRNHWVSGPRVHVIKRSGKDGSTILNLAEGNFVFSDDEGAVEVTAKKGDRQLVVKDGKGAVIFSGPINTAEEREKLPADVKARLEKLDAVTIDFETTEELEHGGAAVGAPRKTLFGRDGEAKTPHRAVERSVRSF